MSYNGDPDWTTNIIFPDKDKMVCPTCGVVAFNVDDVMGTLYEPDYYEPRHISPKLIFTCSNENCTDCDEDFEYELSVVVTAKLVAKH